MVNWTPEQQAAIYEKGSNILVAAAAGSGKTAVLVERIIKKLLDESDPINIDEILVATFTNAAAEEMRQRIGIALEQAIAEEPASYHLKKQLSLLQRASISTLHSFCTSVVRQYAYLLDIDPAFRIADEMEIDLLKHEVIDDMFEDYYGKEGEELERFFTLVDMFSSDRSDVETEELILKLHTFSKQNPWPEKWLERVAEAYHLRDDVEEANLPWLNLLKVEIKEQLLSFQIELQRAIEIAGGADGPYHYIEALEADLQLIQQALEHLDDWNALQSFIKASKLKGLSRKKVECDEEKKDQIKAIRDQFRKEWKRLQEGWFSRSLEAHLADMRKLYPVMKQLTELVWEFEQRFMAVKRERAIVDFNDLEHFSLHILIDESSTPEKLVPSEVAGYYGQQFKEVLVDEYQDINLVQETILMAVSKQDLPGNMFMVGDVKQSIYRFRHAEPTLFIEKYKLYETDEQFGKRIDLAKNFRSREEVLIGANYIFRQIFDESFGEIDYDAKAELVYGNMAYEDHPLERPEMELLVIDRKEESSDTPEEVEELTKIQLEARLYADKIKRWIGAKGDAPLQVVDKGKKRDVQYRDIVILLRSMSESLIIVDELKKQGIPVYAELKTGYFAAIEIQVMINLLKIIDNPYQDIPLASVLRSPIVGLNEEQLAQVRLMNEYGSFYEATKQYAKTQKEASEIVQRFLQQLAEFRRQAREGALSDLIWYMYQETGYYDYVGGIPGGRQRQANLRALYDRARGYESTSFRGLFRFLRFIERMQEERKDLGEARALSEQEDVVRIMTIHKSKGLEFPVVILGNINKEFNMQDIRDKYISDKELGFATKFIDPVKRITYPTLYYLALREAEKRKLLSEEMRVLYVALTRAKEKLVMICTVPDVEESFTSWQQVSEHSEWILPNQIRKSAKSYLDWIGPALVRHKANSILRETEEVAEFVPHEVKQDPSAWHIEVIRSAEIAQVEETKQMTTAELRATIDGWGSVLLAKEELQEVVHGRLAFQYPYIEAAESRAKQSVTEIKRRREVADEYSDRRFVRSFQAPLVKRPLFLQKDQQLTAAEIGTAMHAVMQHIPMKRAWKEAEIIAFTEQLVLGEKLTRDEAEAIDVPAIERFFASEIAEVIRNSQQIMREIPFSYTVDAAQVYVNWENDTDEKVLIQGVIDCIIFTDEGITILDYKTDRIKDDSVTDAVKETLRDRYRVQMELYKQALEDILKQPIANTYLYFFASDLLIAL